MVSLQETKRMAEEAKKRAQATQEQAQRAGQDYQHAVESGFEAAQRAGQDYQHAVESGFEAAQRAGQDYQHAVQSGFEAASRSFGEINRGFQAMATEMTDFSKKRFEDVLQSWEQFLRARSFGDVVEVQTRYAQGVYDAYTSEMSKLGELYLDIAHKAANPLEQTAKRA